MCRAPGTGRLAVHRSSTTPVLRGYAGRHSSEAEGSAGPAGGDSHSLACRPSHPLPESVRFRCRLEGGSALPGIGARARGPCEAHTETHRSDGFRGQIHRRRVAEVGAAAEGSSPRGGSGLAQQVRRQRWMGRPFAKAGVPGREPYRERPLATKGAGLKGRSAPRGPGASLGERAPPRRRTSLSRGQARSLASSGVSSCSTSSGRDAGGNPSPDDERLATGKPGVGVGITSSISPRIAQATRRRRNRLDLSDRHRVMIILGSHPGRDPAPGLTPHYASGTIGVTADLSPGNFETHKVVVGIVAGGRCIHSSEFYTPARDCKDHE